MTDKTFTDEEIVKALECCFAVSSCDGCPLQVPFETGCVGVLGAQAFSLINRQKAEIGRLNKELDELAEELSDLIVEKDILFDIAEKAKPFISPEDVRKMTPGQVRENYSAIMDSMKKWS